MRRLRRLWRHLVQRLRCRRGEHRITVVDVYGELRVVCTDCAYCVVLGRVRFGASNKIHSHSPWERPDDA